MTAPAAQGVEPVGAVFAHHLKMSPDIFDFELGVKDLGAGHGCRTGETGPASHAKVARTVYGGPLCPSLSSHRSRHGALSSGRPPFKPGAGPSCARYGGEQPHFKQACRCTMGFEKCVGSMISRSGLPERPACRRQVAVLFLASLPPLRLSAVSAPFAYTIRPSIEQLSTGAPARSSVFLTVSRISCK
jgi:hypothetical protein